MQGRVALVTGALSGIGRATVIELARRGARVVASGRHADIGNALVTELRGSGAEALYQNCDVRSEADIEALVAIAIARFGRLDIAINNAGADGASLPITEHTCEPCAETLDINVRGVLICMIAELRHMYPQRSGSIINTASTASFTGIAGPGYVASKHAVMGLTRSAALRYAEEGIRVNALCPGATFGGMMSKRHNPESLKAKARAHPMNRIAEPEEMAEAVVFLASDRASYMTGHPLAVDGGFLAT